MCVGEEFAFTTPTETESANWVKIVSKFMWPSLLTFMSKVLLLWRCDVVIVVNMMCALILWCCYMCAVILWCMLIWSILYKSLFFFSLSQLLFLLTTTTTTTNTTTTTTSGHVAKSVWLSWCLFHMQREACLCENEISITFINAEVMCDDDSNVVLLLTWSFRIVDSLCGKIWTTGECIAGNTTHTHHNKHTSYNTQHKHVIQHTQHIALTHHTNHIPIAHNIHHWLLSLPSLFSLLQH